MSEPKQRTGKRKAGKSFGLQVSSDDLKWLEDVAKDGGAAVPNFNRSRLIALGLVRPVDGRLVVTEKGQGARIRP